MTISLEPNSKYFPEQERERFRELLGYLNFSAGKPDAKFQHNLSELHRLYGSILDWDLLCPHLLHALEELRQQADAFQNVEQARAVIVMTFGECFPRYRQHHRDLLFHLADSELQQPFFLARVFEAILGQGAPWEETDRIVTAAIRQLNDFVGFRPVAVLENEQQMEPYAHERYRPVPLYLKGAGVAAGRYERLIASTIQFLEATPQDILADSYFDLNRMEELAIDLRAHDHMHPVNKRTNYMFGEWDPHQIDNQGGYTRFVIRKIILESLLEWMADQTELSEEELLYDASAVLCGTALMASSISGAGPETHSSEVSLTTLLPKVARQRDAFYDRLMELAQGDRQKRLRKYAKQTQQPFGHVRQYLNMCLARYGARQVQHRQIAHLYARMGFVDAARAQAAVIPCLSARFETEAECLISSAHLLLDRSETQQAADLALELDELLHRGIECGAFVDPWNVLGFQAQFPLFSSREDSVPDHRIELLLGLVEGIFGVFARVMGEAAAQGLNELRDSTAKKFRVLGHFWDRYATSTIDDLPEVSGQESYLSASRVSNGLADWREGGEEAGNISFWRAKVQEFESAKAYSLLSTTLLAKKDYIASMSLLIQWLSQADTIGLESGPHSIHDQFRNWMKAASTELPADGRWPVMKKFFDYLEANAGIYWEVPSNQSLELDYDDDEDDFQIEDLFEGDDFEASDADEEEESEIFDAAYDELMFHDSSEEGVTSDTVEGGYNLEPTEFELLYRELEPHLKFLLSLGQLWQMASASIRSREAEVTGDGEILAPPYFPSSDDERQAILSWYRKTIDLQRGLTRLLVGVWEQEIEGGHGDHDSNVEYDIQLQSKFHLLYAIINAYVNMYFASWSLLCLLEEDSSSLAEDSDERLMIDYFRAIFSGQTDQVRKLTPGLLEMLRKKPLLYVPFEHGGQPGSVLSARKLQTFLRFLLTHLPRMGLLFETYEVLYAAYRMEREHRPAGMAVTEFDQLFRAAVGNSLQCVTRSSQKWKSGKYTSEELVDLVGEIVEQYLELWVRHSRSMRLSTVEVLIDDETMSSVREFIIQYGADLFHARMLSLGNVRAILHSGIDPFLDHLEEISDALHPIRLIEDLEDGAISRETAIENLEWIYGSVVDKFDRFLEYNSTTTHSDYGEKFYCFLDFLRVEADYERDAWKMTPVAIAHEILCRAGMREAAMIWEQIFRVRTDDIADEHLKKLRALEAKYGMVLPSLADQLNERFIKPLAVNRMLALVPQATEDAHNPDVRSDAFDALRGEIEEYLKTSSGSAIDIPEWLKSIEKELDVLNPRDTASVWNSPQPVFDLPQSTINLREMKKQMRLIAEPIRRRNKKNVAPKKPPGKKHEK